MNGTLVPFDGPLGLKYAHLLEALRACGSAIVAFSGGTDSAFVLKAGADALGPRVRAVLGASPSVPEEILERAHRVASSLEVALEVVPSDEMSRPAYVANNPDRCFHCKDALYGLLGSLSERAGAAVVLDGTNADDLHDTRPGLLAARQHRVRSPLAELGWTKAEIREASHRLGLETWNSPSSPCLSSRIPFGTPVTAEALRRIEVAERGLRSLGFAEVRVRHYGEMARIELPPTRIPEIASNREAVIAVLRGAGYSIVTLDLDGYRSGGANPARQG